MSFTQCTPHINSKQIKAKQKSIHKRNDQLQFTVFTFHLAGKPLQAAGAQALAPGATVGIVIAVIVVIVVVALVVAIQ